MYIIINCIILKSNVHLIDCKDNLIALEIIKVSSIKIINKIIIKSEDLIVKIIIVIIIIKIAIK